jgi:hypothetical protein
LLALANFIRNECAAKLQSNEQTISNLKQRGLLVRRVMISVPSMKNPPYQQPVPSPARNLEKRKPLKNEIS